MRLPLDASRLRVAFDRAAERYEQAAVVQREVQARLLERLDLLPIEPERILDAGAGPGRSARALRERYPRSQVIALDLSPAMLARAAGPRVCADAAALPFPDACCDLVFSSLMLQWCPEPKRVFGEFRRVLRPGGRLLFTTLGPDTLIELRYAWAQVDGGVHVNDFVDLHLLGDGLVETGFDDPVMDAERITVTYRDVRALMEDLKTLGAQNRDQRRRRSLTGRHRMAAMERTYVETFADDGRVPASYEVIYGHALGPPPGRPRRQGGFEEVAIPVDQLRGSRRRR